MRVPALVLKRLGVSPTLEMVEVAEPGPGEVRVRVAAAGICHTDVGYMQYARDTPVVLGHEGAGVVESVGGQVSHVRPGDHVVLQLAAKVRSLQVVLAWAARLVRGHSGYGGAAGVP